VPKSLSLILLLTLSACAQPFEGRVAARLAEAGLPRATAGCMAERWVERLSLPQLQKISAAADELRNDRSRGSLTVGRFIGRIREINDPEIYQVVSSSSLACALAG
jgi:hypothetical protein